MNPKYELETKVCKTIQASTTQILKSIESKIPLALYIGSRIESWIKVFAVLSLAWAEGAFLMYAYLAMAAKPGECPCKAIIAREVPLAVSTVTPGESDDEDANNTPKPLSRSQALRMKIDPK